MRRKIAQFCDVAPEAVIESLDVDNLYRVPLNLQKQQMDQLVCDHLKLTTPPANMQEWEKLVEKKDNLKYVTKIALVGKYVELHDAYLSVVEALGHAGFAHNTAIDLKWVNSTKLTDENICAQLADLDGIIVPGGFGSRGTEGKISAIRYAREQDIPLLGICLGMQLMTVEFARNVAGLAGANSTELNPETTDNVIDIMKDQENIENLGGTLRLGLYPAKLKAESVASQAYDQAPLIERRHRHRYEFNNDYLEKFAELGLVFSGLSPDERLVEIIEIPDKKFFVGCQFHPELTSRPTRPDGLYSGFIGAALKERLAKIEKAEAVNFN
jgi:CTP synthase